MAPELDWSDRLLGKPTPPPPWMRPAMYVLGIGVLIMLALLSVGALIYMAVSDRPHSSAVAKLPAVTHRSVTTVPPTTAPPTTAPPTTAPSQPMVSVADLSSGGTIQVPLPAYNLLGAMALAVETDQWTGIALAPGSAPIKVASPDPSATVSSIGIASVSPNTANISALTASVSMNTSTGLVPVVVSAKLVNGQWMGNTTGTQ